MNKIKVGDYVTVITQGELYGAYEEMYIKMGLPFYTNPPHNMFVKYTPEPKLKVVDIRPHPDPMYNDTLVGLLGLYGAYVFGIAGVKVISAPKTVQL